MELTPPSHDQGMRLEDKQALAEQFVQFAIESNVLSFGRFTTKAGRESPYFFNAGLFNDGARLMRLAQFYARAILASGIQFDTIFGPAYKGIALAVALAMELARMGMSRPFAYNRKEAKDHGEGGALVGAPLQGRVLIVDDVISAGTAVRHSMEIIRAERATPHALIIALDRQEKASENGQTLPWSATRDITQNLGLQVCAIATLDDLLRVLGHSEQWASHCEAVAAYRQLYGVDLTE